VDRLRLDEGTAREAALELVACGQAAIPELRAALDDPDPLVRRRAKAAMARITGQWGSDGAGIIWRRSLDDAVGQGKPILVLHLFGSFDEEFC
jgi:HEAT repeat protein